MPFGYRNIRLRTKMASKKQEFVSGDISPEFEFPIVHGGLIFTKLDEILLSLTDCVEMTLTY